MKTIQLAICWVTCTLVLMPSAQAELRVGAAIVDITPQQLPVLVNGGMLSRSADEIKTHVNARAVVVDDGNERLGIVVVDSCMLPKFLLDEAKALAAKKTKLKADRILISATHTHTAPSSFGCLGTEPDPAYVPFLRQRLVEALVEAEKKLQPARVGWGVAQAEQFTALRRWVRRPDRLAEDPFGNPTVRANMHAATKPDDVTGQSGPEDPDLSMIVFQATDGTPIAALANFSMHYFSDKAISADYFGLFCDGLQKYAKQRHPDSEMVGIMSHGCSGDVWRRDYMTWKNGENPTIEGYTQGLLEVAKQVFESVEFEDNATIAMAESRIPMKYRVPNRQLLDWSQRIVDSMESDVPKDRLEVYAREQVLLDQMQSTEIVVQAIRIGEIAIASTPNETYALTGLKLKAQSPFPNTMVIELANGADGYIPPPEQHLLGGYNTWAARSAGLEVTAEPRIVATAVNLLETVTQQPRRQPRETSGAAAEKLLAAKPMAYYRFAETEGPTLIDQSGNQHDGVYEPGVCFYLPGPATPQHKYTTNEEVNRCVHFAGGRARTRLASLNDSYCISMAFWNGMPNDARATTGWLLSNDYPHAISQSGEHLGISGTDALPGRLMFQKGLSEPVVGKTEIPRWKWNHLLLVKDGKRLRVYLNQNPAPEIDVAIQASGSPEIATYFIGGRSDQQSNFEGRIDEVAVFKGVPETLIPAKKTAP
jgi:hypothetical protein